MNVADIIRSISIAVEKYQKFLSEIPEEYFNQTPAEGVWSYSEVYSHIISANLSSLLAIQRCIHGKADNDGKISFWGWIILLLGKFPPGKFKAPERIAAMVKKVSKEEARNSLFKLKEKIQELAPKISKCSHNYKIRHPRLGMLNANQWLRFIEIHSYHHLKQLDRVGKLLNKKA